MSVLGLNRKEVDARVQSGRLKLVQDGAIAKFDAAQVEALRGPQAGAAAGSAEPPRDIFDVVQDSVLGEPSPITAGAVVDIARARPGGFWIRVLASIIDSIIIGPFSFVDGGLVVGFLYSWIAHAIWGKTVGKAALGLRVVDVYGRPIGWGCSFFRTFMELVNILTLGIGYLMAAVDDQKRGLHDHAAGTRVVYDR
jgi:hypothetical protein